MYLSSNSRYVLRKFRLLSPSFLNKIEKNLSVKKPKDDPTKPPLRINIPDESPDRGDSSPLRKGPVEFRTTGTSLGSGFQEEIHFASVGGLLVNNTNSSKESAELYSLTNSRSSECATYAFTGINAEQGASLDFKTNASDEVSFDSIDSNITFESKKRTGKFEKERDFEEPVKQKAWYILVDVHSNNDESGNSKSASEGKKNSADSSRDQQNNSTSFSSPKTPKPKSDRKKLENLLHKSKHLSKFSFNKQNRKPSRKFTVHEIEDEATYILYLRLNKQLHNKSGDLGCVPEKEFTIRTGSSLEQQEMGEGDLKLNKNLSKSKGKKTQKSRKSEQKINVGFTDKILKEPETAVESQAGEEKRYLKQAKNENQKLKRNLFNDFGDDEEGLATPLDKPIKGEDDWILKNKKSTSSKFFEPEEDLSFKSKKVLKPEEGKTLKGTKSPKLEESKRPKFFKPEENKSLSSPNIEVVPSTKGQKVADSASSFPASQTSETPKVQIPIALTDQQALSAPLEENVPTAIEKQSIPVEITQTAATESQEVPVLNPERGTQESTAQYEIWYEVSSSQGENVPSITEKKDVESKHIPTAENSEVVVFSPEKAATAQEIHSSDEKASPSQDWVEFPQSEYRYPEEYVQSVQAAPLETETQYNYEYETQSEAAAEHKMEGSKQKPKKKEDVEEKKYLSVHDNLDAPRDKNSDGGSPPEIWRASQREKPSLECSDCDLSDFQTSGSFVTIGRTETSTYPMTFGAAIPPLLREALNAQMRLKIGFSDKWKKYDISSKDANYKSSKIGRFSENSILFPKAESEVFDCESLFTTKDQIILNIIKNEEETRVESKDATEMTKEVEHGGDSSVDSLTMMKKVKEMVQLDLDNVVKIFDDGSADQGKELSSVVIAMKDGWEVNRKELESQMAMRRNDMKLETAMGSMNLTNSILGDEINIQSFKHLPSKKESRLEIQLPEGQTNSVIMFNSKSNEFFICKEALAEAISRKTNESLDEITDTLNLIAKNSKDLKSGDSILVFDDETQSWKVDFSILEKRQQQLQLEEELTKRSELILETFEELEKNQLTTVPKPDTKEKKTFDYVKKEWKDYTDEKSPLEKSTRSKYPFKVSNAEEIRKKNSDLYENLFVAKKKDTRMNNSEKKAPGVSSSESKKESKCADSGGSKKEASTDESGPPFKEPEAPESNSKLPPAPTPKVKIEDDNFWDSFLKMNILPKDISEISKLPPPKVPPTPVKPPVKEPERVKKIESPTFKIQIPFGRRTTKKEIEEEAKQIKITPPPAPPPPPSGDKKEKPSVKAPPPLNPISKEDPKKTDLSKKPPKVDPPKTDVSKQPPKLDPKADISKQPLKGDPPKSDLSKKPPKGDPPKSDPSKQPPKLDPPKQSPKSDPPKQSAKQPPKSDQPKTNQMKDPKAPSGSKSASPSTDHYLSDRIIEISRTKGKEPTKLKTTKIETVRLNITSDQRLPSKVTEINLNKKCEKGKALTEAHKNSIGHETTSNGSVKISEDSREKKPLYKKFEKYRTPFSDPEYEEKSMKIKSDIASNPNLKKLDNWNKTLVLHDIMKPPENIETWLKDETDKMATLLLKILQEASDGKPKKKQLPTKLKPGGNQTAKGNSYEKIRNKQETTPESFLFRVRTVNLSLENEKKKHSEDVQLPIKSKKANEEAAKIAKPSHVVDSVSLPETEKSAAPNANALSNVRSSHLPVNLEDRRGKALPWGGDGVGVFVPSSKESSQGSKVVDVTEEIPGPEILKKISSSWKLLPVLDSQMTIFTLFRVFQMVNLGRSFLSPTNADKIRRNAFSKLFSKYGPIVNVKGPLSGNVILIHKPEHLNAIFEQDTSTMVRSVFDSVEQIRKESEEKFLSYDISTDWTSNDWNDLKRTTNDAMTRGCERYLVPAECAVDSMIKFMRKNRNSQDMVSEDFMEEIKRWGLEGLCSVLFEKSFGFTEGRIPNSSWVLEPDKLFLAVEKASHYLNKCERGFQTWRLMQTPSATGLSQAYHTISSIFTKQIHQAVVNLKNKNELLREKNLFPVRDLTFVESMMLNDGLSNEDINCNLVDILLIGTNMITSSVGFLLYNLSLNIRAQNKLFQELKEALPHKTSLLDYNKLTSLKYLQACVKENIRLNMPIPLFYRMLQSDVVLTNYLIPKGTYVVMDHRTSNQKEYVFEDPDKFLPDRWLTEEKWMQNFEPFSSFPLCHGPRAEFAKKLIELHLLAFVAKTVRNFHLEYHYGEIQSTNTLISFPDKPLKLNFIERES